MKEDLKYINLIDEVILAENAQAHTYKLIKHVIMLAAKSMSDKSKPNWSQMIHRKCTEFINASPETNTRESVFVNIIEAKTLHPIRSVNPNVYALVFVCKA